MTTINGVLRSGMGAADGWFDSFLSAHFFLIFNLHTCIKFDR